jgi:hypothetical protein
MELHALITIVGFIFTGGSMAFYISHRESAMAERVSALSNKIAALEGSQTRDRDDIREIISSMNDITRQLKVIEMNQTETRILLSGSDGQNGLRGELRQLRLDLRHIIDSKS